MSKKEAQYLCVLLTLSFFLPAQPAARFRDFSSFMFVCGVRFQKIKARAPTTPEEALLCQEKKCLKWTFGAMFDQKSETAP